MSKQSPNPGSPAAVKDGCKCPVIDNGHGKGSYYGKGIFIYNADCPIHGCAMVKALVDAVAGPNVVKGAHKVRRAD